MAHRQHSGAHVDIESEECNLADESSSSYSPSDGSSSTDSKQSRIFSDSQEKPLNLTFPFKNKGFSSQDHDLDALTDPTEGMPMHPWSIWIVLCVSYLLCFTTYVTFPTLLISSKGIDGPPWIPGLSFGLLGFIGVVAQIIGYFWTSVSYKQPLFFTSIAILLGNTIYILSWIFKSIALLMIGRCLAAFDLTTVNRYLAYNTSCHNRLRFMNFRYISESLGIASGLFIGAFLTYLPEAGSVFIDHRLQYIFDQVTIPAWFCLPLWVLFIVVFILKFRDPWYLVNYQRRRRKLKRKQEIVDMSFNQTQPQNEISNILSSDSNFPIPRPCRHNQRRNAMTLTLDDDDDEIKWQTWKKSMWRENDIKFATVIHELSIGQILQISCLSLIICVNAMIHGTMEAWLVSLSMDTFHYSPAVTGYILGGIYGVTSVSNFVFERLATKFKVRDAFGYVFCLSCEFTAQFIFFPYGHDLLGTAKSSLSQLVLGGGLFMMGCQLGNSFSASLLSKITPVAFVFRRYSRKSTKEKVFGELKGTKALVMQCVNVLICLGRGFGLFFGAQAFDIGNRVVAITVLVILGGLVFSSSVLVLLLTRHNRENINDIHSIIPGEENLTHLHEICSSTVNATNTTSVDNFTIQ